MSFVLTKWQFRPKNVITQIFKSLYYLIFILERDRSRLRPEILHPIDLQSGGVEVVTITPKSQNQALYEKNQKNQINKSKSIMKKLEESKDSGHETSSIHTENSENESNSDSSTTSGQVS